MKNDYSNKEWLEKEIRESYPACIGRAKVRWRRYELWNRNHEPNMIKLNILWSLIPDKYIGWNRLGVYIKWPWTKTEQRG